jgi:putative tryptophan/tyrosine transport system substrate-binding protein
MHCDGFNKREVITLLGGAAAAWPLGAPALPSEQVRRIGVLMGFATTSPEAQGFQQAFGERLRELGWTDGARATVDYRWAAGDRERFKAYASELVALKPDVILAHTTPAVAALRQETTSIPIVFVSVTDPVGQGLITNLARPGGNMTGFDLVDFSVGGKWLQLLKEVAPAVTRVAIMYNPQTSPAGYLPSLHSAAASLRVEITEALVRDDGEIERAITAMSERPGGGLIVMAEVFIATHRAPIIGSAARHRLPAMYPRPIYVRDGGLMGYGTDVIELFKSAAGYVDRILKGADPGELPVQRPTKFELALNLKTAKTLGIEFPAEVLALADEVIE